MTLVAAQLDSRLPAAVQRFAFGGVPVVKAELPAGHFWLACDDGALLIVAHLTPADFLADVHTDRLWPVLHAMREYSDWCYLLVSGDLCAGANDKLWRGNESGQMQQTGWNYSAVQGVLVTCQEIGVVVTTCNGLLDLEPALVRLANRDRAAVRVAPVRDTVLVADREAFVTALPGIGPEKIEALREACGPEAVGWWLHVLTRVGEGTDVPGIGPKTRARVRAFLGLPDDQELSPVIEYGDGTESLPESPVREVAA